MATHLANIARRWIFIRLSFFVVAMSAFVMLGATFPSELIPLVALGSSLGIIFSAWSILKGDWWWGKAALVTGGAMLGMAILLQVFFGAMLQALPEVLLGYVMLLFSAEGFALISEHHGIQSMQGPSLQSSQIMVKQSLEHLNRKSASLAVVFGGAFVISVAVISVGELFAAIAPALSDLSIYIVVVSVSLALLLTFRED